MVNSTRKLKRSSVLTAWGVANPTSPAVRTKLLIGLWVEQKVKRASFFFRNFIRAQESVQFGWSDSESEWKSNLVWKPKHLCVRYVNFETTLLLSNKSGLGSNRFKSVVTDIKRSDCYQLCWITLRLSLSVHIDPYRFSN